jgi:hypothetical protein
MDLIDEKLTTYSRNRLYHASIHSAVQLAKATLNRYYQLTDQSEVYRIAMGLFFFVSVLMAHTHTYIIVLHLRHKLIYFRNARWEDTWITTAEKLVCDQFALYSALDADLHLLSHVHSHLSAQSMRALLCLSFWSKLDLVKTDDIVIVSSLPNIEGDEEELNDGWDQIIVE